MNSHSHKYFIPKLDIYYSRKNGDKIILVITKTFYNAGTEGHRTEYRHIKRRILSNRQRIWTRRFK